MINCHDLRGKGIVFFLLVIYSGLSCSCIFENDPISDDYMRKIQTMEQHMPSNYEVERPRMISEEKTDQYCFHMLTLFLSNYTLANIQRHPGSKLDKMIINLQNEIYFISECLFKTPSTCPNEKVNIFTVFQNLNASLAALKPHIENNFTHCLHLQCAAVEHSSTLKNTGVTRRRNKGEQDSTIDELSEEHTTPMVKFNDSSSQQLAKSSNRTRNRYPIIFPISIVLIICIIVIL